MRSWIIAGLLLAASAGAALAADTAAIQFRPVVDCDTHPGAEHLSIYSPQAHCLGEPVVTERDFVRLERLRLGGSPILRGELTEEAQLRFYEFTVHHRFRPMALLVQGRPTEVWVVRGPSYPVWLLVSGGYLSDAEANQVADKFYADGGRD